MKAKLTFNNDSVFIHNFPCEVLEKQMKRPQHKRLYVCGVDFTQVKEVTISEGK